jgi:rubrerythrin
MPAGTINEGKNIIPPGKLHNDPALQKEEDEFFQKMKQKNMFHIREEPTCAKCGNPWDQETESHCPNCGSWQ